MYLGGSLIESSEATHETCKRLGLVCPLCSESVFFRAGYTRTLTLKNGEIKIQEVEPIFSHYKTEQSTDYNCENRIVTKAGREQIEKFQIEAKNQRLKLYNKHLWKMYKEAANGGVGIERKNLIQAKRVMGDNFFKNLVKETRKNWKMDLFNICCDIKDSIIKFLDTERETLEILKKNNKDLDEGAYIAFEEQRRYFGEKCDLRLHISICWEISEFFSDENLGVFLGKLFSCFNFSSTISI